MVPACINPRKHIFANESPSSIAGQGPWNQKQVYQGTWKLRTVARPPRGWQTNLKELAAGGLQERRTPRQWQPGRGQGLPAARPQLARVFLLNGLKAEPSCPATSPVFKLAGDIGFNFDSWDAPGAGPNFNFKFKPTVTFGRRTPSREPAAAAIRSKCQSGIRP